MTDLHVSNSSIDTRSPLESVLVDGLSDRGSEANFYFHARMTGLTDCATIRAMVLGMITEALIGGYVVPGDISNGTFVPWYAPTDEAIIRIARTWIEDAPDSIPSPGAIAWFVNTPLGDRLGEAVLRREGIA